MINKDTDQSADPQANHQQDLSELSTSVSSAIADLARDLPSVLKELDKLDPNARLNLKQALERVAESLTDEPEHIQEIDDRILELGTKHFRLHPWHGIGIGEQAPDMVNTFIEITPTDTLKFELDKESGHLKIDRPQMLSNVLPVNYGFVPRTYCGEQVAEFCEQQSGRTGIVGDGDPLDICIYMERNLPHGNILLEAVPIGGFRMIDNGEADDKIIAVLKNDPTYGDTQDVSDLPASVVDRLKHYFLTYKDMPGESNRICEITHVYGRDEAHEVIRRSQQDYTDKFK